MKILGTTAEAAAYRTALDGLAGMPRRSLVYGGPDMLPTTWSAGAAGWTESLMLDPAAWGAGYSVVTAPDSLAQYLGQTHGPTTLPAFGAQMSILLAGQSNAVGIVEPKLGAEETLVIKSGLGATSLYSDWVPGGTLFNAAVLATYATTAQELWWVQGETDAANQTAANAYETKLTELIAAFRTALARPTLLVRVAILNIGNPGTYRDTVRAAQNAVCAADANVEPFDMDGYTLLADNLHYSTATYTQIGIDLGNAYVATL
jgi:hypothetical protein